MGCVRKKVLLLWRGVGKSTLVDLWVAYKLSKDAALRFLLLSYDRETAKKSSRNILNIIKTHPLCTGRDEGGIREEGLYDKNLPVHVDSYFIRGNEDDRNPSVRAYGIGTSGTGGRSDYIIFDDVEDPNNSGTEHRRFLLRARISEAENTLIPETGKVLFIGTYHDEVSIYDDQVEDHGARLLRIPIMTDTEGEYPYMTGRCQWAERWDENELFKLQKKPKNEFFSQYLLIPKPITDSYFDTELLRKYKDNMEVYEGANDRWYAKLRIGDEERRIISSSCYWDPALSTAKGDASVVAVVLTDDHGRTYIHRVQRIQGEKDAELQCKEVKKFALRNHIAAVVIEDNGIGAFLEKLLLKELRGTGIGAVSHHIPYTRKKAARIIESYEGPLYGGTLYVHQSVYDGPFLRQFSDFDPTKDMKRDDFIDAPAGAIEHEPHFIGKPQGSYGFIEQDWQGGGSYESQWEFAEGNDISIDDFSGNYSFDDLNFLD